MALMIEKAAEAGAKKALRKVGLSDDDAQEWITIKGFPNEIDWPVEPS